MGLNLYNMLSSTSLGSIEDFFLFLKCTIIWCFCQVTLYNCFAPRMGDLIQRRQMSPWLWPEFLYVLLKDGREHKRNLDILHNFTDTVWSLFKKYIFIMIIFIFGSKF